MKGLTGMIEDLPEGQTNIMQPDLDRTAGQQPNAGIIKRAVELLAQEYIVRTVSFILGKWTKKTREQKDWKTSDRRTRIYL